MKLSAPPVDGQPPSHLFLAKTVLSIVMTVSRRSVRLAAPDVMTRAAIAAIAVAMRVRVTVVVVVIVATGAIAAIAGNIARSVQGEPVCLAPPVV